VTGGKRLRRIVVVGAGPTGLGAAHRLHELGFDDYVVLEAGAEAGGLARSYEDDAGFTYDVGGHVFFSHYEYYDRVVENALVDGYSELDREAWVWIGGRFVRYPFQNSLRDLDPEMTLDCVMGLVEAERRPSVGVASFADWMLQTFGTGITEHFMRPYNSKVWATPPELLSCGWIAERVSVVDLRAVLRTIICDDRAEPWGPNGRFRYPLRGGTGALCTNIAKPLLDHIAFECPVVAVDPQEKTVDTADGRRWHYDLLLSTMPLNRLVESAEHAPHRVRAAAARLAWTSGHIVGIGLDRPTATTKNWIYFPESTVPFYRVTYLSNYSPFMTPVPGQTLLLAEVSRSPSEPSDADTIVDDVIDGLLHAGLMTPNDRSRVLSRWLHSPRMTYPVPTLDRDAALAAIHPWLSEHDIASRGRFGAWLYEIGNMDHSFMQGVEWVDAVLCGDPEQTWKAPVEVPVERRRHRARRTAFASNRR
jgi:UDP-galactopyranose mutase